MSLADLLGTSQIGGGNLAKLVPLTTTFEAIRGNLRRAAAAPKPGIHPFVDERSPGFHASGFYDVCPRQEVLTRRHDVKQYNCVAEKQWPHLLLGTMLHELWQNSFLGPSGILIGHWECAMCGMPKVNGHDDKDSATPNAIYLGVYPGIACPCVTCGSIRWKYREIAARIRVDGVPDKEDWHVVGRVDGLTVSDVVLDFKSIYATGEDNLGIAWQEPDNVTDWVYPDETLHWSKSGIRRYYMQIQIYLAALDKEDGLFIYLPKDKLHDPYAARGVHIRRNRAIEGAVREKIQLIWRALNNDAPLPRRICNSPVTPRAQSCAVCNECFATP